MEKENNVLIVVDFQGDFVSNFGKLPVPDANNIIDNIQKEIDNEKYTHIIYTMDTHLKEDYYNSEESKLFPEIHCEFKTQGWNLFGIIPRNKVLMDILYLNLEKPVDFSVGNEYFFMKDKFSIWEGNKGYKEWFTKMFNPLDTEFTVVGVATNYCVNLNISGIPKEYKRTIKESAVRGIRCFPNGEKDESYEITIQNMKNNGIVFVD
jgi:nicotinamidase-related amidase